MDEVELKETQQQLELTKHQLWLTTAVIRELKRPHPPTTQLAPTARKRQKISISALITNKKRTQPKATQTKAPHLSTAEFVTEFKGSIRRDITERLIQSEHRIEDIYKLSKMIGKMTVKMLLSLSLKSFSVN